jgi:hypothetical protein
MHRLKSPYCVSAELPLLPASLHESNEECHHSSQDEIDDYVGLSSSDNENDDIHSPSTKVARLSSPGGVSIPVVEEEDVGGYEFVSEHKFPANIDDEVHVELVELCRQIGAPLYAYNSILKWGQEAHAKGYTFPVTALKYNAFMSDLAKRLELDHLSYTVATIEKSGGGTLSFPTFNFEAMFVSLLDDPRIQQHLLINWDHPSKPPPFNNKKLDEIHSGSWHRKTSAKLLTTVNDILCGLILFIDRTHVADKEKLTLCPVLFSLSIIPRWLRNHSFAWRPIGFLPKLPKQRVKGQNADTTHRVLGSILSGVVATQRRGGIRCSMRDKFNVPRVLFFKVPICFIIGDVEGHDLLCGRYSSHQTKRLCRECDCPMEDADNGFVECIYTKAKDIKDFRESNNVTLLQEIGYHGIQNAFDKLDFGAGNPYGINRATMSENLHTIQKGWYLYALKAFFGRITPSMKAFLESLVERISFQCAHQSDRNVPRLKFANGIIKYKHLHAHETPGVILLIVIALHSHISWDTQQTSAATAHSFGRSQYANRSHLESFRHLFETLLCMEAWLKQPVVQKLSVNPPARSREKALVSPAKYAMQVAINLFVDTVDRTEGSGMKLTKVHCVLHAPDDISTFGSAKNWDTGPCESGHIDHCKKTAKLTQLRKDSLEQQTARQTVHNMVMNEARSLIWATKNYDSIDDSSNPVGGSHLELVISSENNVNGYDSFSSSWIRNRKQIGSEEDEEDDDWPLPPADSLKFACNLFVDVMENNDACDGENANGDPVWPEIVIPCFTEHKIQGQIYRAHPSYRETGPWHDWVLVEYYDARRRGFFNLVGEIMFFVDLREKVIPFMSQVQGVTEAGTYAVIHSLDKETAPMPDSCLLSTGTRAMTYNLVNTTSFKDTAFVIDNVGCPRKSVLVIRPTSEWAQLFC